MNDIKDYYSEDTEYYICNATTMQFKSLAFQDYISEGLASNWINAYLTLAFNPLKSAYYKVISLRRVDKADKFEIDVYSSETE